jgi:predicted transglutaminase-like cysteine proteinase
MFSCVTARKAAGLFVLLLTVAGGPPAARAQWQIDMAALDPAEPSRQAPAAAEPFGLDVTPVTSGDVLSKWNGVAAEIRADGEILARCRDGGAPCPAAAQKFLAVIAEGRAHSGRARFGVINRAINLAIRPTSDLAQWGVEDRWSAPLTTLATGRGDCEDYAIAKYVALKEAGVPESDVRLLIVRDLSVEEDHAVVAVRLEGQWIVLDNRRFALIEDADMHRVIPLFVIDHEGVKQFAPVIASQAAAPAALGD